MTQILSQRRGHRRRTAAAALVVSLLLTGCAAPPTPMTAASAGPASKDAVEAAGVVPAATAEDQTAAAAVLDHRAIRSKIAGIAQEYGAAGVQTAIINDGRVVGEYAWGWATRDTERMTTEHKIRVASVSKVILAMGAMLLHEDGLLDLDGDIGQYWDVETAGAAYPDDPVSVRTILSHTSAIPCYGDYYSVSAGGIRSRLSYGVGGARPGDPALWCYNNYAFSVLGATMERAAGQTVDEILGSRLFEPLGIDASFAGGDLEDPSLVATLYRGRSVEQSSALQQSMHLDDTPGENSGYYAGGLNISAGDLARLIALLANDGVYDGRRLMEITSVAQMENRCNRPLDDGSYQAHPMLYVPQIYGRTGVYYHPGNAYGAYCIVSYDPETRDGVVVLTTGASGEAKRYELYSVCDEISEFLYEILSHRLQTDTE